MFLDKQVRSDDDALQHVYSHFRQNLEDIARNGCRAKANVIFCTIASNLKDCPPFASLHRLGIAEAQKRRWEEIYEEGVEYERAEKYGQAIEKYLSADAIDNLYADLQFRLGRCYWRIGEYEEAKTRYILARELDTLRFRADDRINEIVRDIASNKTADGVYLVDAVKVFEQNSPHQTPGEELFYEHVHMNFKGNYLLAMTVFEKVEQIIPEKIRCQKADDYQPFSEAQCAKRLAYTDWSLYKIAEAIHSTSEKLPYSNQLYHDERFAQAEKEVQALKSELTPNVLQDIVAQYRNAIQSSSKDWLLHKQFALMLTEGLKDYAGAAKQYQLLLKQSNYYAAHVDLGGILLTMGNIEEGAAHSREAIRIKPTCAEAYCNLANVYEMLHKTDKAVKYYYKTLRLRPDYLSAYASFIQIMIRNGRIEEAVEMYRKTLPFIKTPALKVATHIKIGDLLVEHGRTDEAISELNTALQIDPNSIECRKRLEAFFGALHGRQGEGY